jgi:hypothetical protein
MILYGVLESEITRFNVYRKTGHAEDVDNPVERDVRILEGIPMLVEPLNPVSPFTVTFQTTHRIHSDYRDDLRSEDRLVELDHRGRETSTRYTIKYIHSFKPHHLELYVALDSQPLVL